MADHWKPLALSPDHAAALRRLMTECVSLNLGGKGKEQAILAELEFLWQPVFGHDSKGLRPTSKGPQ